jgi:hypothetical protein
MIETRRMRWAGRVCSMNVQVEEKAQKKNAYRILVGNSEGKRTLGRPRCRCVDKIEMDIRLIG